MTNVTVVKTEPTLPKCCKDIIPVIGPNISPTKMSNKTSGTFFFEKKDENKCERNTNRPIKTNAKGTEEFIVYEFIKNIMCKNNI